MTPRPAATIILLREPNEVLMVQRNPDLAFMGGYWVFPGGKVEDVDADLAATARREVLEEVGIDLPPEAELVPYARWITPVGLPRRFDTWFFLARADDVRGAEAPTIDDSEIVAARWVTPQTVLSDGSALAFPTRRMLEQIGVHSSADALIADSRGREIEPVLPEIVHDDGSAVVRIPGESGPGQSAPEVV